MSERTRLFGKGRNIGMGWVWRMTTGGEVSATHAPKRITEEEHHRAIAGEVIELVDGSHLAYFPPMQKTGSNTP